MRHGLSRAMRALIPALALLFLLSLPASPVGASQYPRPDSRTQVDVGIFYDGLTPYGDWVEMPDYGWAFAPRVDYDWRPYTRGQWIWTYDGWYWDSDEDFGWAAYHYGRWVNDRYYGWVWIPGVEWAPAWVSWRHGNGYTGWAPLPPRARWQTRIGLSIGGLEIDAYIGARDYSFVADRSFVDRGLYQRVLPATQNLTIINVTNNVTNYTFVGDRVVNGGVPIQSVERSVGHSVPRTRAVEVDRADAPRRAIEGEVSVYRPSVRAAPERRPAQGHSMVKGEAPPPLLVERRQRRDAARQQSGGEAEVTAKDVQQRRPADKPGDRKPEDPMTPPAPRPDSKVEPRSRPEPTRAPVEPPQTRRPDPKVQQQEAQQQRDRQQADKERARQEQDAQAQADQRAKDAQRQPRSRPEPTRPPAEQAPAQRPDAKPKSPEVITPREDPPQPQPQAKQRQDQASRDADQQRARDQEQANQQRAKRDSDAQADKRPKDAPPPSRGDSNDRGNKKNPKPTPTPPPANQ